MDALVMCGGRGTRLAAESGSDTVEKPLVEVDGEPMVDAVLDALDGPTETTYAVVSPHTPETAAHVDVPTIETPGDGYVADLDTALERVSRPVLTAAADLPLLTSDVVVAVLDTYEGGSLTVCVPAELKRELGVSVDTTFESDGRELVPTGLNVVGGNPDRELIREEPQLAINVNRPRDREIAESWERSEGATRERSRDARMERSDE